MFVFSDRSNQEPVHTQGPVLMLVYQGSGDAQPTLPSDLNSIKDDPSMHGGMVSRGDVFFVPAGAAVKLAGGSGEDLKLICCGCSPRIF